MCTKAMTLILVHFYIVRYKTDSKSPTAFQMLPAVTGVVALAMTGGWVVRA